jgi:uncharacterized protein
MAIVRVRNASTQRDLGTRIRLAANPLSRARGLVLRPKLKEGEGLLIKPCQALRMTRLTQTVDAIMVGPDDRIIALYPSLKPGEKTRWHTRATYAVEVPPGTIASTDTQIGDEVVWGREKAGLFRTARSRVVVNHQLETTA